MQEISSPDLGSSKERVKRIEGVLEELVNWLEEEKDLFTPDETSLLNMPFSLEVNRIYTDRKRRLQEKQKLTRELKVIEACVQILYIPFAKGAFDFAKINQEDAITRICKLAY